MIDGMLASFRGVAAEWRDEVQRRRAITIADPVADTLEHCASELEAVARQLDRDTVFLRTVDYARLVRKTPQTVRTWIRRGQLKAERLPDGDYRIRRDAKRDDLAA